MEGEHNFYSHSFEASRTHQERTEYALCCSRPSLHYNYDYQLFGPGLFIYAGLQSMPKALADPLTIQSSTTALEAKFSRICEGHVALTKTLHGSMVQKLYSYWSFCMT